MCRASTFGRLTFRVPRPHLRSAHTPRACTLTSLSFGAHSVCHNPTSAPAPGVHTPCLRLQYHCSPHSIIRSLQCPSEVTLLGRPTSARHPTPHSATLHCLHHASQTAHCWTPHLTARFRSSLLVTTAHCWSLQLTDGHRSSLLVTTARCSATDQHLGSLFHFTARCSLTIAARY